METCIVGLSLRTACGSKLQEVALDTASPPRPREEKVDVVVLEEIVSSSEPLYSP